MRIVLFLVAVACIDAAPREDFVVRHHYGDPPNLTWNEVDGWVLWDDAIGPKPTPEDIEAWTPAYEAWKAEQERSKRVDRTNDAMARWVEHLTLKLIQKGVLTKADIPPKVLEAINTRRAIRGEEPIPP